MKKCLRDWTLALAASMVLVGAAGAQTAPAAAEAPISASLARLLEIKVELAWLANRDTFPYPLAVRVDGHSVVVGGQVPNPTIKQQALFLARQETGLEVVDRLTVEPTPVPLPTRIPFEKMCRLAMDMLAQTYPQAIMQFVLDADSDGRITIAGEIGSYEEKLAISRRLSRVPSCQCVKNNLTVRKVTIDGKNFARLTADGQQMVLDENPAAIAPREVKTVASTPSKPSAAPAAPAGHQPSPRLTATASPPAGRPGTAPPRPISPYGVRSLPSPQPTTSPAAGVQPVSASQPVPASQPASSRPAVGGAAATQPATLPAPVNAGTVPYDPRMTTASASALPNLSQPSPPQVVAAPGSGAAGLVVPQPPQLRMSLVAHTFLKNHIEKSCAGTARSVEVLAPSDSTLLVRLRIREASQGGELIQRILNLPEIQPFQEQVSFEVHVVP